MIAGGEGGKTGYASPLLPCLGYTSDHYVLYVTSIDFITIAKILKDTAQKIHGADGVKRSALFALAPWGANGVINICCGH